MDPLFQTGGRCGSTEPSRSRWRSDSGGDWAIPSAPGKLGRRFTKLRFSRKTTTMVSIASNSFGSAPSSAGAGEAIATEARRAMSVALMRIPAIASLIRQCSGRLGSRENRSLVPGEVVQEFHAQGGHDLSKDGFRPPCFRRECLRARAGLPSGPLASLGARQSSNLLTPAARARCSVAHIRASAFLADARGSDGKGLRSSAPDEFISVRSDGTECPYPLAWRAPSSGGRPVSPILVHLACDRTM